MTKNLVTSLNSLVAAALFIGQGAVLWTPTLIMMAGALVGAFIGARLAQIAPHAVMRVVVVAVGALLTVIFAWRYGPEAGPARADHDDVVRVPFEAVYAGRFVGRHAVARHRGDAVAPAEPHQKNLGSVKAPVESNST